MKSVNPAQADLEKAANELKKILIPAIKKALSEKYEEAGVSGLCEEGRFEVALGGLETLPFTELVSEALRNLEK